MQPKIINADLNAESIANFNGHGANKKESLTNRTDAKNSKYTTFMPKKIDERVLESVSDDSVSKIKAEDTEQLKKSKTKTDSMSSSLILKAMLNKKNLEI